MTCEEATLLVHALDDLEPDASHANEIEAHVASCARCAALLRDTRAMSRALADAPLRYEAPASLRARIRDALPQPQPWRRATRVPSRRSLLQGFAMGSLLSG